MDKNALDFWFPKLAAAGLPVPKTIVLAMPEPAEEVIRAAFDRIPARAEDLAPFVQSIRAAGDALGWPCFLRTMHTSGKHRWARTCYLDDPEDISNHVYALAEESECAGIMGNHVYALAEESECAGIMGLPWDRWAVRELLPTKKFGECPHYYHMPVSREFRVFVADDRPLCVHPYWPARALSEGGADMAHADYVALCACSGADMEALFGLAFRAGQAVGGAWSVDILDTERGWYITDMALARDSWHWPDCPAERSLRTQ